jgi:hypothetical protein
LGHHLIGTEVKKLVAVETLFLGVEVVAVEVEKLL